MKKLQIMAGMLSVLLLAGCGGAGASAKTTEGDPPQVASAASGICRRFRDHSGAKWKRKPFGGRNTR